MAEIEDDEMLRVLDEFIESFGKVALTMGADPQLIHALALRNLAEHLVWMERYSACPCCLLGAVEDVCIPLLEPDLDSRWLGGLQNNCIEG